MNTRRISFTAFLAASIGFHLLAFTIGQGWLRQPPTYAIERPPPVPVVLDLRMPPPPEPPETEPPPIIAAEESAEWEAPIPPEPEPAPPPPEPEPVEEEAEPEDPAEEEPEEEPAWAEVEELPFERPVSVRNPPPRYPAQARRQGWEGVVVLRAQIDRHGRVASMALLESSGHTVLDRAAMSAIENWLFVPAQMGGQPIAATVDIPVRFEMENE